MYSVNVERNVKLGILSTCIWSYLLYLVHCLGRNKKVYEPPRYMTAADAAQQLMTVVANRRASGISDLGNLCYCFCYSLSFCR